MDNGKYELDKGWVSDIPGAYPFIPFAVPRFIRLLQDAVPHVKTAPRHYRGFKDITYRSFLDIGCGRGSKVLIAQTVLNEYKSQGWVAHGIEINPRYVKDRLHTVDVKHADGLTYANYADHDILYMYCPFQDVDLQVKLQQAAIDGAAPGAVIIFAGCCKPMTKDRENPYTDVMERIGEERPTCIIHEVWRKKGASLVNS